MVSTRTTRSRGPAPEFAELPTPSRVRKAKRPEVKDPAPALENITNKAQSPAAAAPPPSPGSAEKAAAVESPPPAEEAGLGTCSPSSRDGCAELDAELRSILSPTFSTASDFGRTPPPKALGAAVDLEVVRDPMQTWGDDNEAASDDQESDEGEDPLAHGDVESLIAGMGALGLRSPGPLRGVPAGEGEHVRFEEEDDGELAPVPSPSNGKLKLAGVPVSKGTHVRF